MKYLINTEQIRCDMCDCLLLDRKDSKTQLIKSYYEVDITTQQNIKDVEPIKVSGHFCSKECLVSATPSLSIQYITEDKIAHLKKQVELLETQKNMINEYGNSKGKLQKELETIENSKKIINPVEELIKESYK